MPSLHREAHQQLGRARRAPPLQPEERRAALVAATLPLLLEQGAAVSTRAIAEASGVAEGTLFRVFPTKDALIAATIAAARDQEPLLRELAAVDRSQPLRPRMVQVTVLLQQRITDVVRLLTAMGGRRVAPGPDGCRPTPPTDGTVPAVAALLEPDAAAFRCPPLEVARLLRLLAFSGAHPMMSDGPPLTPDEIVAVVLDGVLVRQQDRPC